MSKVARSVVDVLLGEATSGSPATRYADMISIASTIANRAAATGVTMDQIVAAENQYSAYGRSLPPGVEAFRDLAEQALADVQRNGPTTRAQYYSTPSAVGNLPSGLTPVGQTAGHAFFEDPQGRAVRTSIGYRVPEPPAFQASTDQQARNAALDALFGFGPEMTSPSASAREKELDAVFGLPSGPSQATPTTRNRAAALDAVFGFETPSGFAAPTVDDPNAEWDGSFSSPLGSITDRTTSEFGPRDAPSTSLGVGSANHAGIDLSAAPGVTGYASNSIGPGTVVSAGPRSGYGLAVEIEHPNGFTSRYGHLASLNVAVGDQIAAGTPIGTVGQSGNVSGAHMHLEVRDPTGQPVNPRDVIDFTRRADLAMAPTSRPMSPTEQATASAGYRQAASSMAAAGIPAIGGTAMPTRSTEIAGLPSGFNMGRFAPDVDPSSIGSFSSMRSTSTAGLPAGFDTGRFAPGIDPSRIGNAASLRSQPSMTVSTASQAPTSPSMPSAERFGYGVVEANPPSTPPSRSPASMPTAERFGRTAMTTPAPRPDIGQTAQSITSTAKTGRLASQVTPKSATPQALNPTQGLTFTPTQGLSFNPVSFGDEVNPADFPTRSVSNVSVPATAMGLLPSPQPTPLGPYSKFNPNPVNVPANVSVVKVSNVTPTVTPPAPVAVRVTPRPVAPIAPPVSTANRVPTPTPRPSFSALDVWSGRAPAGYQAPASGGSTVSRDRFGNTTIGNRFGASTTFDPSGRMAANFGDTFGDMFDGFGAFGSLGGLGGKSGKGSGIGARLGRAVPGLVGATLGTAIAGPVGGLLGAMLGNRIASNRAIGPDTYPDAPSPARGSRGVGRGRGDISDRARADIDRGNGGLY